ncbi:MAG: DHHA1 domain-containing protein [Candidatus Woesearchaeota archaeon]|jgi:single-stranded DNA-specific DHH superfamily exonuclease
MNYKEVLLELVKDKKIILATHWDADGVSSGAMVYHLIKNHIKEINTISKGEVFLITPKDIEKFEDYDYVICVDIKPSLRLPHEKVIYFDHHPNDNVNNFKLTIYDHSYQSTSLLLYEKLLQNDKHPLYIFLALLGYFGDQGELSDLPTEIKILADEMIPEYMRLLKSYGGGYYTVLESLVSSLNVGKRMDWSGDICLELLMAIEHPEMFCVVPQYETILRYKQHLKNLYNRPISINSSGHLDFVVIECPQNIQGVLCARYLKKNPILIMNKRNGWYVGSMRVPDEHKLDAGILLEHLSDKIKTFDGGGHTKAGGFRFKESEIDSVLEFISQLTEKELVEIANSPHKEKCVQENVIVYD